jgi:hypothetical protein
VSEDFVQHLFGFWLGVSDDGLADYDSPFNLGRVSANRPAVFDKLGVGRTDLVG